MNYIGICDDDDYMAEEILKTIVHISKKIEFEIVAEIISKPHSLLEKKDKIYDTLFLDIDMPDMNGIDLACQLREEGIHSEIIFVTNEDHRMQDAFRGEALRFTRKIKLQEEMEEALLALKKKLMIKQNVWTVVQEDQIYDIKKDQMLYIESDGCYVNVYEKNKPSHYFLRISMKEVEKQISDFGFIRCHKQYIVNLNHIKSKEGMELVLTNEKRIPISKRNLSKVKNAILKNMRRT